jgi:hypothetical protein
VVNNVTLWHTPDYTLIMKMCVPYRIGDQRSICYDRTGEILIGRDNVKKSFSSKEDEVNLSQCLS